VDPDAALTNMRDAVRRVNAAGNAFDGADAGQDLAEAANALDDWLTRGGFLPAAWSHDTDAPPDITQHYYHATAHTIRWDLDGNCWLYRPRCACGWRDSDEWRDRTNADKSAAAHMNDTLTTALEGAPE
jgi:hypothetical protein